MRSTLLGNFAIIIEMMEFKSWLREKINEFGWSNRELAKYCDLSEGTVRNLVDDTDMTKTTNTSLIKLARGLHVPPMEIFGRYNGLWPSFDETVQFAEWLELIRTLSEDEREEMLAFMRAKIRINEQRGVYLTKKQE